MPTATYEPIATTTLSSAATNITFSSIASTWTDLKVVLITQSTGGYNDTLLTFNNDTASNYAYHMMRGNGTSATASRGSSFPYIYVGTQAPSPYWQVTTIDIFNYAGSTMKPVLSSCANEFSTGGNVYRFVGRWTSTSAITSIKLATSADNFSSGTTATLYGIKAA